MARALFLRARASSSSRNQLDASTFNIEVLFTWPLASRKFAQCRIWLLGSVKKTLNHFAQFLRNTQTSEFGTHVLEMFPSMRCTVCYSQVGRIFPRNFCARRFPILR